MIARRYHAADQHHHHFESQGIHREKFFGLAVCEARPMEREPKIEPPAIFGLALAERNARWSRSASARNAQLVSRLGKLVAWMVIFEISMVLAEILMLFNGGTEPIAVAKSLLTGKIGILFVGVEIVIGAIVPVVILLRAKSTAFLQVVASLLILIGIYTMRYIVIAGGQLIG